jgi:hypothetical protein
LRLVFFAWSAVLGNILTKDNFRKRHVIVIDKCCVCRRNRESVDHLFLHCAVACALWSVFLRRFGLSWVMSSRVVNLLAGKTWCAVVWKMVPLCLLLCLWMEMNDRNFEDHKRTLEELESYFFYTFFLWTIAFISPLVLSCHDFFCSFLFLVR